jgi:hypothetical protein
MERTLWLVAGIAIMIAATALLQTARRIGAPAQPTVQLAQTAGPPTGASPPTQPPVSPVTSTGQAACPDRPLTAATTAPTQAASAPTPNETKTAVEAPSARSTDVYSADDLPVVDGDKEERKTSKSKDQRVRPRATGRTSAKQSQATDGFDKNAARRALTSAALRARQCVDGKASGSVVVTFAPSGLVQSATLASIKGEMVREACVLRAFRMAQIAPYVGKPVTVRKRFRLR